MDRKTALEKITERFEAEKDLLHRKFLEKLAEREQELIARLYDGILQLDAAYPVQIIQFQMMRADLYQGHCCIVVRGYNVKWYLDTEYTECRIPADELFEPFREAEERMEKEIGIYLGAVSTYDIKNLICEYFFECFLEMADRVREKFYLFDEWAQEKGRSYTVPYRIVWGEYRGRTQTIFYQGKTGKTKDEIQKELDEAKEKEAHLFCSWVESDCVGLTIEQENFAHLNMKRSRLEQTAFRACMIGRAMFQDSVMDWCSFEKSMLYGCNLCGLEAYQLDFKSAKIGNSALERSSLRKAKFDGAELTDVSFTDGKLSECSFRNAKLCRVDLRAETLSDIDFTGARLEEVLIHAKDAEQLSLTPEQMEQVLILKEEVHELL